MTSQTPETRIYLIRHGSVENPKDIAYGRLPVPLSLKGREEVADLCRIFKSRGIKFDCAYTSPVLRAVQSAIILDEKLGVRSIKTSEDLTDVGIGELQGKPMQILRDANYIDENLREMGFAIESKNEIVKRFGRAISEVLAMHPGESVAFVSHGDVTRLGLHSQEFPEKVPPRDLRDSKYLATAEAVVLKFEGDRFIGYDFIRRSSSGQIESDNIRRAEAY